MSSPYNWTIQNSKQATDDIKFRLYALDTLRDTVGHLEHSLREVREELSSLQDRTTALEAHTSYNL